jgi:hypothetical protein
VVFAVVLAVVAGAQQHLVEGREVRQVGIADVQVAENLGCLDPVAGEDGGPGRRTNGATGERPLESHPFGRHPVEVGCLDHRISRAAQGVESLFVGDDEQQVDRALWGGRGRSRKQGQHTRRCC